MNSVVNSDNSGTAGNSTGMNNIIDPDNTGIADNSIDMNSIVDADNPEIADNCTSMNSIIDSDNPETVDNGTDMNSVVNSEKIATDLDSANNGTKMDKLVNQINRIVYKEYPYYKGTKPKVFKKSNGELLLVYEKNEMTEDGFSIPLQLRVKADADGTIRSVTGSK